MTIRIGQATVEETEDALRNVISPSPAILFWLPGFGMWAVASVKVAWEFVNGHDRTASAAFWWIGWTGLGLLILTGVLHRYIIVIHAEQLEVTHWILGWPRRKTYKLHGTGEVSRLATGGLCLDTGEQTVTLAADLSEADQETLLARVRAFLP